MKGLILTNAYTNTGDIAYQPERLKEEFEKMGVQIDVRPNDFFPISIFNGEIENNVSNYSFCIFLDKDKYALKGLEKAGVKIYNAYEPITVCDDKMLTYLTLANNCIPMPKTLPAPLCFDKSATVKESTVDAIIQKLGLPVIVKECFGSLGKGVYLAKSKQELTEICQNLKDKAHLFQEFVSSSYGKDIRIIVIGGEVIGAIMRVSNGDFRSNISSGGHGEIFTPTDQMKNLAVKISKVLNLDYCGMDFLLSEDGTPTVCEANSNAFFKGFEKVTGINVAKKYAEFILNDLKKCK
ncbi:MAG: RimK family alpha-L-glutamate ligase [Clostridiales bacterium]|nr:RimK family alpha-L-glutamate ligase [Clostridiales bacterium]